MLQAQRLLETSDYSVDEVAGRCGFRSPVALRGHFRRQLGSSPAAYRAAYRARRPQGGGPEPVGQVTEQVVPAQAGPGSRRAVAAPAPAGQSAAAPAALDPGRTEQGRPGSDAYAAGRPALPGQRSAP